MPNFFSKELEKIVKEEAQVEKVKVAEQNRCCPKFCHLGTLSKKGQNLANLFLKQNLFYNIYKAPAFFVKNPNLND